MKLLSEEIKKFKQEKDFLLSQNALRRVGIQACENQIGILKDGNYKVNMECARMDEENLKFKETHTQTKLQIDDHAIKI